VEVAGRAREDRGKAFYVGEMCCSIYKPGHFPWTDWVNIEVHKALTPQITADKCDALIVAIRMRRKSSVRIGSGAAVARCGERVSLAPESRPTASSIDHLFSARSDVQASPRTTAVEPEQIPRT
jgi:hypothetical protein